MSKELEAIVADRKDEFEAAMVAAGYHKPERSPFGDGGYLYSRDEDRYVGFCLSTQSGEGWRDIATAPEVMWTGWYHPDPEGEDDFCLYDAKDHRCDDCIRVHVVRAELLPSPPSDTKGE